MAQSTLIACDGPGCDLVWQPRQGEPVDTGSIVRFEVRFGDNLLATLDLCDRCYSVCRDAVASKLPVAKTGLIYFQKPSGAR